MLFYINKYFINNMYVDKSVDRYLYFFINKLLLKNNDKMIKIRVTNQIVSTVFSLHLLNKINIIQ